MQYITPGLILLLLIYAMLRGVNIYESFVEGAKEALPLLVSILPYMAAMMTALSLLRGSGALSAFVSFVSPVFTALGMPDALVPMFILRPFSGSAATALLNDVFQNYGVDSFEGFAASLMLGSTETIFYTIALYFGSVGVKRTRHAAPSALISGIVGAYAAILLAYLLF